MPNSAEYGLWLSGDNLHASSEGNGYANLTSYFSIEEGCV